MSTDSEWNKTTIRLEYRSYTGGAERDDTGYLQGFVEGLVDSVVVYDGNDVAELAADFVRSIDEYLLDCEANNVPAEPPKILSVM